MTDDRPSPRLALRQVVLDCRHPRTLAEFYRRLLRWTYRPGDEPPPDGADDPAGADWLVIIAPGSGRRLAFQAVPDLPEPTWPGRASVLHLSRAGSSRRGLTSMFTAATILSTCRTTTGPMSTLRGDRR